MGNIQKLAEQIKKNIEQVHEKLRKTIKQKLAILIAVVINMRTTNTSVWASVLPMNTDRIDMKMQWISRFLSNKLVDIKEIMEPYAKIKLLEASRNGQRIILTMDQTDMGGNFGVLVIGIKSGKRALPLIWKVKAGKGNLGFEYQKEILETINKWLPEGAQVLLMADRYYPSKELFMWLKGHKWDYRPGLRKNLTVDIGNSNVKTIEDLVKDKNKYYEKVKIFDIKIETNIGIWHEKGYKEPWIIAMDCQPALETVRDYRLRWGIEAMFSDFKTRGFGLSETHLKYADGMERLMLLITLAMYWCVEIGRKDEIDANTPIEKEIMMKQMNPGKKNWRILKRKRSLLSWFQRGLRKLLELLEKELPLPNFLIP